MIQKNLRKTRNNHQECEGMVRNRSKRKQYSKHLKDDPQSIIFNQESAAILLTIN